MSAGQIVAGRFQVGDAIGHGGMGDVYRGADLETGLPVAIKLLRADTVTHAPGAVERFQREGDALRRLDHPNIVKILATLEENDAHYIIMEYVEGGSLRDLLDRQPQLPVRRVLEIGLDLADALARAHRLNIIHRDLKPANVLLAADGTPRLTDFGISQIGDRPRITQSGMVLGTEAYLSPEACRGSELDARTDIWSFGAMLYEMLAGRPPFEEQHTVAMLFAILTKPVPDLLALRPDLPPVLVELIERMLEKDRDLRIPSVRMIGAELESILHGSDTPLHVPVAGRHELAGSRFVTPTQPELSLRPHNLPPPSTPFVGRREELDEIKLLLGSAGCRLLTLLGPGGTGKTRLAVQAAFEQLERFAHGVYFVALAPLGAVDVIVPTIAEALKFSFYGQGDARQQLLNFLREKEILLVMDNFEHLIAGADLMAEILNAAPRVKILVTSRARLNLQQEWVWDVPGMAFPEDATAEQFEQYGAVQLFVQSARRVQPGFQLSEDDKSCVARICQLVGGMPLGIELAAAWVRLLTLDEIAQEIERSIDFLASTQRDVTERHRSVRAVFEYSWNLLVEPERDVLQRLSVFRGGFRREAAQTIAGASLPLLSALLDKSLLRRNALGRFEVHELLRQFAAALLDQRPAVKAQTRDRHAAYYAGFLHQRENALKGGRAQKETLEEIREEIENIRAAWSWAVENGLNAALGEALEGLALYYLMRSGFQEGVEALGRAIERLGSPPSLLLGRLLVRQGELCQPLGQYTTSKQLLARSLDILRALDAPEETALACYNLGTVCYLMGEFGAATANLNEALLLYREFRSRRGIARCLNMLGVVGNALGNYQNAQRHLQESLALYVQIDDRQGTANTLNMLSVVSHNLGELDTARRLGEESLVMCREIGDARGIGYALGNLGGVMTTLGEYDLARQLHQESLTIRREIGDQRGVLFSLTYLGDLACQLGAYDSALDHFYQALRIATEIRAVPLALWVLLRIATSEARDGETERAAELLATIINHPAVERATEEGGRALLLDLEKELAPERLHAALERGQESQLEDVVSRILLESSY